MKNARVVVIGLALISVALVGLLIAPFAGPLFVAAVLAGALYPWCDRLTNGLRGRRQLAAGILTLGVLLMVVLPLATIAGVVIAEAADAFRFLRDIFQSEGVAGLLALLPETLQGVGQRAATAFGQGEVELHNLLATKSGTAAAAVGSALARTGHAVVAATLMLVALYFLLAEGRALVAWLDEVVPLGRGHVRELLADFRRVSVAVLMSTGATAALQALAAMVGYLVARVPHPFFFTLVTFFCAFIPAVGAAVVSLALALLLLATGHPVAAGFLALWGVGAVGLVDNIVKPMLIRGGLELHSGVIFFALLGGITVFGLVGLVAGPLVVAFLLAVIRLIRRDFAKLDAAPR